MWDVILEIIRAVIIGTILFHLLCVGKKEEIRHQEGWWYIVTGFSLTFFASVLDFTDNFPSLNKFIIIGDTKVESFFEKVFGYLFGSLLLAIGFWKWMPTIIALGETKKKLKESYNELELRVEERTADLRILNEQLHQEIANRKLADERFWESEDRYTNLVENVSDVIYSTGEDGAITSLNLAFEKITGWSRAAWLGKSFRSLIHPDDLPRVMGRFQQILMGETPPLTEFRILSKSRDYLVGEFTGSPQIKNGKVVGLFGIARDVTHRKKAEEEMVALQEQLRQSQKMEATGRLAGGIAHDFNNLLTIIKGYSQLSLIDLKEGDPLRGNIEEIQKASERAADLTRQLLAFSRRQVMEMKVLNLNTLLIDMEKMLRRVIGEDIALVTVLADALGRVKADTGQIENVIINLAVNARDAMPSGGKLIIETSNVELDEAYARSHVAVKPGRYVMFSVSDTGMGMTQEVKERIFEPFFTTKEKGKGTGLGSSTVYGIVKQSGGNIWVYSEPGSGTTFKIYLPRVDEPLEENGKIVSRGLLPCGNETVLVVEDEEEVRNLTVQILQRQGYRVLEASHGKEALYVFEKYRDPIHLVVTDVVMPEMSGSELAKHLSTLHPDVKLIYMSGYTDSAIIHNGILKAETPFIQKPFTPDILARRVREVLDR